MSTWNSVQKNYVDGSTVINAEYLNTLQSKVSETVSVKDFGASSTNSAAQNKTALQLAITHIGTTGGIIEVPYDCDYGYKTRTPATWPDFSGVTKPVLVIDYSAGDTQLPSVYPTAYDGMQARHWFHTPPTTAPGMHDGNTQWFRSSWAPAYCISNDMNIAAVGHPSRTAMDNRRAYYATMVDGQANWQWGNGTLAGAALTDEEMSNFVIQKFEMDGDTLGGFIPYLVERKTGNISYGGGRNIPAAHHHFEAVTGSPANYMAMVESPGTTCEIILRNSTGASSDVAIKNSGGLIELMIVSAGVALSIDASRNATFNECVRTLPKTVTTLPSAATVGAGARSFVTDSPYALNSANVGGALGGTGGGSNAIPVYSDGANWRIG